MISSIIFLIVIFSLNLFLVGSAIYSGIVAIKDEEVFMGSSLLFLTVLYIIGWVGLILCLSGM